MPEATPPPPPQPDPVIREKRAITRRAFAVAGIAAALGVGSWKWVRTREPEDGIPWPLRRMLRFNERLASSYFNPSRLAPTFPAGVAAEPRVNGDIGQEGPVGGWSLLVEN